MKIKSKFAIAGLMQAVFLAMPSLAMASSAQTAFYVSTNGSAGQANYDIRLNPDCSPQGNAPVHSYWSKADGSRREFNSLERQGYAISSQAVTGNTVRFTINAFQRYSINKPMTITTSRSSNGTCQIQASTSINGVSTPLSHASVTVQRNRVLGATVGLRIVEVTLVGANQQTESIACRTNCSYGL